MSENNIANLKEKFLKPIIKSTISNISQISNHTSSVNDSLSHDEQSEITSISNSKDSEYNNSYKNLTEGECKKSLIKKNKNGNITRNFDKRDEDKSNCCNISLEYIDDIQPLFNQNVFLKKHKRSSPNPIDESLNFNYKRIRSYTDENRKYDENLSIKRDIKSKINLDLEEGEIGDEPIHREINANKVENSNTDLIYRNNYNKNKLNNSESSSTTKNFDSFSESSFEIYARKIQKQRKKVKNISIENEGDINFINQETLIHGLSHPENNDCNTSIISNMHSIKASMNHLRNSLFGSVLVNSGISEKFIQHPQNINEQNSEIIAICSEEENKLNKSDLSEINNLDDQNSCKNGKIHNSTEEDNVIDINAVNININDNNTKIEEEMLEFTDKKEITVETNPDVFNICNLSNITISIDKNTSVISLRDDKPKLVESETASAILTSSILPLIPTDDLELNEEYSDSLNLYNAFFKLNEYESESMKEIENLMKNIQINDEAKKIRRLREESRIDKIKNEKKAKFNNSFLLFFLDYYPFESIMKKQKKEDFKINLVLDIDSTLLCAENSNSPRLADAKPSNDIFTISPKIGTTTYTLLFKIRKHIPELLQRMSKFCNLYIHTHGQEPYAKEVLRVLKEETGVEIQDENVCALKNTVAAPKSLKQLSNEKSFYKNSLIIDDNVKAWECEYYDNMIQSMKFLAFFNSNYIEDKHTNHINSPTMPYNYNYLLTYNRPQECNDFNFEFIDENNVPLSLEFDFSKKYQIVYLIELLENVYKLCLLKRITAVEALLKIKQNILSEIIINLDFLYVEDNGKKYIKEIIKLLGGRYDGDEKNTTNYLISNIKINEFRNYKANNIGYFKHRHVFCINLKWIFHCFFYFKKVDENDPDYKMIV